MLKRFAIIVAGGSGSRMGAALPKQFTVMAGKPLLMYSLETFFQAENEISIILVLPENHISHWQNLCTEYKFTIPHKTVAGGESRGHSVKNGLSAIEATAGIVGVHDGARPLVVQSLVREAYSHATLSGNAVPCIPVKDSLRQKTEMGSKPLDRSGILAVQTPQCFQLDLLRKAYEKSDFMNFTDDAQLVESLGVKIELIEGSVENLKITFPVDLILAEAILDSRSSV